MMIKPASEFIAEARSQCNCLDAKASKALYDECENAVIIDVREQSEANESKLKDSINIQRGLIEYKIPDTCPDPNITIFTHCAAGGRASLAAARLQEMGYKNVYVISAKFDELKEIFG